MLRVERRGEVSLWTIARPEAKNALNAAVIDALGEEADRAARDPSLRAIVITGEDDAFASGGDLRELRGASSVEDAERFADAGGAVCAKLAALDVPVIAALPGIAFGGGAELAIACDLRVADLRAKISFKQARMAVTPAWGSVARLVHLVGPGAAGRLLFTAQELLATDAANVGLVDQVTPDGTCVSVAFAWARDIALGGPRAIAEMKALIRHAAGASAAQAAQKDAERLRFVATWTSRDHVEAMDAYFERRTPVWGKA